MPGRCRSRFRRALAILLALGALPAQAHIPHDHVTALSPAGATVVAVIRGEYYISRDSGLTWQRQSRGIVCPTLKHENRSGAAAISPDFERDGTAYLVCAQKLFRSTDGGRRYAELAVLPTDTVVELAVAPDFAASGVLLARDGAGRLVRSADRGASWSMVAAPEAITALAWQGGTVLAGTADGRLFLSPDGGAGWQPAGKPAASAIADILPLGAGLSQPFLLATAGDGIFEGVLGSAGPETRRLSLPGIAVTGLTAAGEGEDRRLFATTRRDGVYRSLDQGATWQSVNRGLQTVEQAVSQGEPDFDAVVPMADGTLLLAGFSGLFRSADGGDSWVRLDTTVSHIVAMDITATAAGDYLLGVVPYAGGILISPDGGQTWRFDYSGLDARRTSFAFSPDFAADGTMFSGNRLSFEVGAARPAGPEPEPAGESPAPVALASSPDAAADGPAGEAAGESLGEPARWQVHDLQRIAELNDAAEPPTPVALMPSPAFAEDGTVYVGLYPHGVLRARDRGRSLDVVFRGAGEGWASVMSPGFAGDRTLFTTADRGLYRSTDAGASWTRLRDFDDERILLGISPDYPQDRTLFAATESGLWRSRDGGDTWQEMPLPAPGARIAGFAVAPSFAQDGRLLLQTKGADLSVGFLGPDGVAWQTAAIPDPGYEFSRLTVVDGYDLFAFSPDFAEDHVVYGGAGPDLLKSADGGLSWQVLPPLPRRYEADYVFSPVRNVPVNVEGAWELTWTKPEAKTRWQRYAVRLADLERRILNRPAPERPALSGEQSIRARDAGAGMTLDFIGHGVRVIGTKGPEQGQATIEIDGTRVAMVDLAAATPAYQAEIFTAPDLPPGLHRLRIEIAGGNSASGETGWVEIDAFDVLR